MKISKKSPTASGTDWPVVTRYDQNHLRRIALPLGGIGTGTISLGGRGDLRDWEIVNRPAKGFAPQNTFFAIQARSGRGEPITRALEGPLDLVDYEGMTGCQLPNHSLPRFRKCRFEAAYPLGQAVLSDPDMPVEVRLQAFNPMIPADAASSGIPVAVLRYVLTNKTAETVTASVCGNVQNFIGQDGTEGKPSRNANEFRTDAAAGVFMRSDGVEAGAEQWGTMALATTARSGVSHRTAWANVTWGDSLLDFWDDFSDDGRLEDRDAGGVDAPMASLAVSLKIPPRSSRSVTFLIAWHFPNRQTWTGGSPVPCIGNYYTGQYSDAWDVIRHTAPRLPKLEDSTLQFVRAFCDSDLPHEVKEAALFNLSTLRTQTCFRTPDGLFYGWEGCHDKTGCCYGSCTHVWNYEQATAFLFGELSRSMREVEFAHATRPGGQMNFRVDLPLIQEPQWNLAAADGQMGCLMKLYRDWQLSGSDEMLRRLWPGARQALEFCWIPGGWDADRDGVMEGCQHNTMDVEYYGPNPQMGTWYLGALRAAEEMARHLGEDDFAATCRDLFERGSRWMDEHLYNGEYYEHEIRPPQSTEAIAPGLRHDSMGSHDLSEPDLQLGAGCLIDQLVGQYMAHVCGLGYLLNKRHVRTTLRSLMKYNFKNNLSAHFNHLRTYALGDESAMLMATYPRGRRPRRPFPYYNEVMTGFEYTAAVHMLQEGQSGNGLKMIAAIRDRYDGLRRSPFDEAECGHHYARAMASWAAVLALTGFHYSGVEYCLGFAASAQPVQYFWSNGDAWGTCRQKPSAGSIAIELVVLHGSLKIRKLELTGYGATELANMRTIKQGETLTLKVSDT